MEKKKKRNRRGAHHPSMAQSTMLLPAVCLINGCTSHWVCVIGASKVFRSALCLIAVEVKSLRLICCREKFTFKQQNLLNAVVISSSIISSSKHSYTNVNYSIITEIQQQSFIIEVKGALHHKLAFLYCSIIASVIFIDKVCQ